MVRRFSWCTVAALVVLLFVTTEGLRERSAQVDDHKTHDAKDRGALRYNFKSPEETTTSASSLSRTRSSRDRTSNLERHNGGSISKSSISEAKVESNRRSNFRTARTTERNGVSAATETTNTSSRTLEKSSNDAKRVEPTVNRRNGKRHPSENAEAAKSKLEKQNGTFAAPKGTSRRTFNKKSDYYEVTERLDNTGPSVFTATTESSRSRTGRKIQTSYTTADLKTQVPTSRKFNNRKFEGVETTTTAFRRSESRGRSTTERTDGGRPGRSKVNNKENNTINRRSDSVLSESESVRVDIPLAVEATESLAVEATTDSNIRSQRQSSIDAHRGLEKDTSRYNSRTGSERSKSRGRSSDTDATDSPSKNSSRRGASRFHEYSTTEASEQFVSSRRNTVPKDRSRNLEPKRSSTNEGRPRSRGRNLEHNGKSNSIATLERDVKRKSAGDRISPERRSRVPDLGVNVAENRGLDQDTRGRTRSRSRVDVTTSVSTSDAITTLTPDTTVSNDIATTSTETEVTSTTTRAATPTTTATASRTLTTTARPASTTASSEGSGRNRNRGRGGGSQGRKQPKEDFFNHGLGFRGRKPAIEGARDVGDSRKPTASKNESQYHGTPGWTLRRRPGHLNNSETVAKAVVPSSKDQTNEVIPSNELSTSTEIITSVESVTATTRRGFKKQQSSTEESSTVAGTTTKSFRRGNKTFEKSKTSASGKGAVELEESDNYPPEFKARLSQLVKKSSAALFAERSRMKLDLARRLVKPELNIEENDLDATTASSFSKPTSTSSAGDGTSKVGKFVKPGAAERRGSTEASQDVDKGSKLFRSGKSFEDSKVTVRPSTLRKGRVISERMVTSISVEERPEEAAKSYTSTNPSVSTAFAEEGSATTIDTTRVRLSALRGSKKSREDDKPYRETNDSVTTFKPKKPYVYQSRNSKTQDQSATVEQTSVTATPKKSHSTTKHNTTHRKSQASQEEFVTKKPKFTEVSSGITKATLRPRYSKRGKAKSVEGTTEDETLTTRVPLAISRYSRKKSIIKSADKAKVTTTAVPVTQTKKQEFRPRTATYRRHSEVPTTLVETTTKVDAGVAITPRVPRYHAILKSSTASPRSVPQEPQVNLNVVNDTVQQAAGITGSSNGDSGSTNIFSPATSVVLAGNNTLLEQLRSTVAPLLSSLGNKTPIFSGSYSNVNSANSAPRITPSGSPPRFSARYKGAELFVRKQNNIYQPTVPSITSSSTTPVTPVESNIPSNAQMGTTSNVMPAIAGRPPTDSQGSRIVQDRERDEATRTKEAGGQRSSVYIGQSASNEGPSASVPSFENLLNNQPGGQITAPPGFPWRDPLDQIFGITTPSPVITASVASNTLDDSNDANGPVFARPVNPFVEVFTPFSSAVGNIRNGVVPTTQPTTATAGTTTAPRTTTTTTAASTTSTTTMASTATATPAPITTTTTTMAPTTTTTTTTTTAAPVTVTASAPPVTTVNFLPSTTSFNLPRNAFPNMQQQNAFGTSFDDLAFLNSLLQENSRSARPKTLTQVEQLLANKILSLALTNPGPTRAPKAINVENASPNSIYQSSPKSLVGPIVIDLSPSSTAATPTWKPTEPSTEKPISTTTIKPLVQSTPASTTSKTTLISTTKAPIAVTAKTTARPRTTTPPALGFGASLWQALFGNGLFAPPTTQRPAKPKPVKTTPKSVSITPKPVPATQKPETTASRTVDVSKIQVSTPNSLANEVKSTTESPLSTTKQPLLNNPNPRLPSVATSTFSPEDDAKFLLALLQAAQAEDNKATAPKKSPGLTRGDESFLRAILSGRALTTTTTPAPSNDISDAALLAALLKAQGIEPSTPATDIREQLLLASLGQSVSSAPNSLPAAESTTITTRPASSATRPTVTTKKSVTTRPTSGPRIRTTTWSPSSTYPPPLFSSFSNYDNSVQSAAGGNNPGGGALFGATRAFSQFLGAALSGAAQQLQSLVRNGTRIVSEVVG